MTAVLSNQDDSIHLNLFYTKISTEKNSSYLAKNDSSILKFCCTDFSAQYSVSYYYKEHCIALSTGIMYKVVLHHLVFVLKFHEKTKGKG